MDASKFALRSKTIIVNGLVLAAVMLLGLVDSQADGTDGFSFSQKYLPADWQKWAIILQAIGNIVLRYLTTKGIRLLPAKPEEELTDDDLAALDLLDDDDDEPPSVPFRPAAMLLFLLLPAVAGAAPPDLKVSTTEPKIPGQRLIIDATESIADRIEILVWADGLPEGPAGLEQFRDAIEQMRDLGAEVTLPAMPDGEGYVSKFRMCGDRIDLIVLDTTAGAHYRIDVVAFTNDQGEERGGTASMKIERRIPGNAPSPVPPTPPPPGPGPTPPNPTPPAPGPAPVPPGPAPTPTPVPPTPPTPPEPQIPEGRFGVAKLVYGAALQVQSTDRAAESQRIAKVLQDVADKIKTGSVAGNDGIRKALLDGMGGALDSSASLNWRAFGEMLAKLVVQNLLAGKLRTPTDWFDFLLEVAQALLLVG